MRDIHNFVLSQQGQTEFALIGETKTKHGVSKPQLLLLNQLRIRARRMYEWTKKFSEAIF